MASAIALLAAFAALVLWMMSEPDGAVASAPAPKIAATTSRAGAEIPMLGLMRPMDPAPFAQQWAEEQARIQRCLESIGLTDEDRETVRVHQDLRGLTAGQPLASEVAAASEAWGLEGLENKWSFTDIAQSAESDRELMDHWVDLMDGQKRGGSEVQQAMGWPPTDPKQADRVRLDFLEATGRVTDAVELASQSYQREPSAATGYDLAYAYSAADQWSQARAVAESALSRAPESNDSTWLNYQVAAACSELGDDACVEKAIGRLELEGVDPSLVSFSKGYLAGSRFHHVDAIASFDKAWEQRPDFATAFNIGLANMCMGKPEQARDWFVQAKDQVMGPRQSAAVLTGAAYTHLDDGDAASSWMLGAAALAAGGADANSVEPRVVLALAALAQKDLEEARWQMQQAVRADPSDDLLRGRCFARPAEAEALRALQAEQRGQPAAAQAAWRKVAAMPSRAYASAARRALAQACLESPGLDLQRARPKGR